MSSSCSLAFFLLTTLIAPAIAQRIVYFYGLNENESCEFEKGKNGTCRNFMDCANEFEEYRKNQTALKVCKFGSTSKNDIVCCPKTQRDSFFGTRIRGVREPAHKPDILNFKVCRNKFLKYRDHSVNPNHFVDAMISKKIPIDKENCEYLDMLNRLKTPNKFDYLLYSWCELQNGTYHLLGRGALFSELVERGDRPNMAAIGWIQENEEIEYNCGGSIITERFIVTAAHCKFFNGKEPDLVRLGDRFLKTEEDDDIAQQLRIEKFILHPDYRSRYHYNDIAMIKTTHKIIFNKFVVPSCIDDLNSERIGYEVDWKVAGYGETENRVRSNVLLELRVVQASYEECNRTYKFDPTLPYGIHESQFCVRSKEFVPNYPDTCFGDSGSPLQFKTMYDIPDDDFETSYISTIYEVSTVLGIVSFGLDCGFNVPSVYTKLAYFKDWMRSVIKYY